MRSRFFIQSSINWIAKAVTVSRPSNHGCGETEEPLLLWKKQPLSSSGYFYRIVRHGLLLDKLSTHQRLPMTNPLYKTQEPLIPGQVDIWYGMVVFAVSTIPRVTVRRPLGSNRMASCWPSFGLSNPFVSDFARVANNVDGCVRWRNQWRQRDIIGTLVGTVYPSQELQCPLSGDHFACKLFPPICSRSLTTSVGSFATVGFDRDRELLCRFEWHDYSHRLYYDLL